MTLLPRIALATALAATGCTASLNGSVAANAGGASGRGADRPPAQRPAEPAAPTPSPTASPTASAAPGGARPDATRPAATPTSTPAPAASASAGGAVTGNVRGRLMATDGAPFRGKLVVERRQGGLNDPFMLTVRGLFAVTTLGLSEIFGLFTRPFREVEVGAEGAYGFELSPAEAVDGEAGAYVFEVTAVDAAGARVTQRAKLAGDTATLAAMRFWDGVKAPSADATLGADASLSLTPPAEPVNAYSVLIGPRDEEISWYQRGPATSGALPAYRFAAGERYHLRVLAHHADYVAASAPRVFKAGDADPRLIVPASVKAGDGAAITALTDGDLLKKAAIGGSFFAAESDEIVLDLGSTRQVARLVGFGGKDAFPEVSYAKAVEVYASDSPDAWGAAIATTTDKWFDLDLADTNARYLRLKASGGAFALAELRVVAP